MPNDALKYPVSITQAAPGDFVVRFQDVPEAISGGATRKEALAGAPDALAAAILEYLERGRPAPKPTPNTGRPEIALEERLAVRCMTGFRF